MTYYFTSFISILTAEKKFFKETEVMVMKFYSREEVAEIFGENYQLIYKLVKSGELPSVRIGKMFRVSEA